MKSITTLLVTDFMCDGHNNKDIFCMTARRQLVNTTNDNIDLCPCRVGWLSKCNIMGVELKNKINTTAVKQLPTQSSPLLFFIIALWTTGTTCMQIVHKQWLQMQRRAEPEETVGRDVYHCFCCVCTAYHVQMWT